MKEKVITALLNLIKVKSILTFVSAGLLVYMVRSKMMNPEAAGMIIVMVFESLFKKDKTSKGE